MKMSPGTEGVKQSRYSTLCNTYHHFFNTPSLPLQTAIDPSFHFPHSNFPPSYPLPLTLTVTWRTQTLRLESKYRLPSVHLAQLCVTGTSLS